MNKLFVFLLLILGFIFPIRLMADHLDDDQVAKGKAEHVFCGVNVYKTKASDALKMFGKPATIETNLDKDSLVPPAGDKDYIWEKFGMKMELYTGFYTEHQKKIESETYAVDAWGEKAHGKIGVTGQGLSLGDSISKVEKTYGKRFYKNKIVNSGLTYVEIEWQDGTQLMIDFDKN